MQRNHLIDGLRGIAAIIVVIFHASVALPQSWAPRGYLAVDFFFLLSGFVIGRIYHDRLTNGLGFRGFLGMRVARLYPAYLIGCLLGIFWLLRDKGAGRLAASFPEIVAASGLNLLMLPGPRSFVELFPTNVAAWSLFFEMLTNLLYAWFLYRFSVRTLSIIAALLAAWMVYYGTSDIAKFGGWKWQGIGPGFLRTLFSFTIGVIVARSKLGRMPVESRWAYVAIAFVIIALVVPGPGTWRTATDMFFVMVAFPIVFALVVNVEIPKQGLGRRLLVPLGLISYPLYAIHLSVIRFVRPVGDRLALSAPVGSAVAIAVAIFVAWLVARTVEPAMRRWLSMRLTASRPAVLPAASDPGR